MIMNYPVPRRARELDHAIVYRRENQFASHPYVRGFWETSKGHLIANFAVSEVNYAGDPMGIAHVNLIHNRGGARAVTVKSEDRGQTWKVTNEDPMRPTSDMIAPVPGVDGQSGRLTELAPINYLDKDTLLTNFDYLDMRADPNIRDFVAGVSNEYGPPEHQVYIRVSKDAGDSWSRSVLLPKFGLHALWSYDSSMVRPDGRRLIFLTGIEHEGGPLRPLVYRSTDDGTSFHFMSFITRRDDPSFSALRHWYPRGIMLPNGRILCSIRMDRNSLSGDIWTEIYKSDDGGRTWQFLSRPTEFGAPAEPLLLSDGRVALVYTYRLPPYGIRAVVSEDGGLTWGGEIIVRDDGGSWDLGYQRAWEVSPGRLGAIYYFNDKDDPVQVDPGKSLIYNGAAGRMDAAPWGAGGVRYIGRSFFSID